MHTGVAILKLEESLYEDIKNGKKCIEIRKLNKDYIQPGYTIVYIGVNSKKILGEVKCIGKIYQTPAQVLSNTEHEPTKDFVNKAYEGEDFLIQFTVSSF